MTLRGNIANSLSGSVRNHALVQDLATCPDEDDGKKRFNLKANWMNL